MMSPSSKTSFRFCTFHELFGKCERIISGPVVFKDSSNCLIDFSTLKSSMSSRLWVSIKKERRCFLVSNHFFKFVFRRRGRISLHILRKFCRNFMYRLIVHCLYPFVMFAVAVVRSFVQMIQFFHSFLR
jgi:hypothetical protein